ncbi:MAG: class E sortase [Clostridiales bacterium]|nr:class E sortase [Clostridiales bacterium]
MGIYHSFQESRLDRRKKEKRRNIIITTYVLFVAVSIVSIIQYRAYLRGEAESMAAAALLALPGPGGREEPAVIWPDEPADTPAEGSDEAPPGNQSTAEDVYKVEEPPYDKLFITGERRRYKDQDLTLVIPKLNKTLPIYNGVTQEVLKKGAGLYDFAQLPGEGNRNVSIAGHRNTSRFGVITDNAPFYYIDKLKDGDYLYLTDEENVYRYLYEDTRVVEADDWGPIYSQGFSCLTITSCTPIGIGSHRIVVRGRLDEIFPLSEGFEYVPETEIMEEIVEDLFL